MWVRFRQLFKFLHHHMLTRKITLFFSFYTMLAQSLVLYLQLPVLRLSFNDDVLE